MQGSKSDSGEKTEEIPSKIFVYDETKWSYDRPRESGNFVWANTTPLANENLPFAKDYRFEPCLIQDQFREIADQIRNFAVRPDDVWIVSYPKTGSTWVENIIWQLRNGTDSQRRPIALFDELFLENFLEHQFQNYLDKLANAPSPRIIKSHLAVQLLPIQLWKIRPKIVYVARNSKDVAISLFYMLRDFFKTFNGTIEEFFDIFLADQVEYAPFHPHVLTFWKLQHLIDHLLFLTYEEISADRFKGIKKIASFLGCKYNDDELKVITDYASFGNMQKLYHDQDSSRNETDGNTEFRFFRKGKSGGFRDEMSEEFIEKFNEWSAASLKDSDFKFSI